jgi:hypothetical protein
MTRPLNYTPPALLERKGVVLLKVRASPGASRERIGGLQVGGHGEALRISVTAPPEKGKANEAIIRLLAGYFGLRESQVSLHSGEKSKDKWFCLQGLTLPQAEVILRSADDASKTSKPCSKRRSMRR